MVQVLIWVLVQVLTRVLVQVRVQVLTWVRGFLGRCLFPGHLSALSGSLRDRLDPLLDRLDHPRHDAGGCPVHTVLIGSAATTRSDTLLP